jgi:eukaryotic-like serine/threonine-protein kinase
VITERLATALKDRYRIERELGTGGMATVYLAEDLKHKRKVALKVLKPELTALLGADRFVQEIETTASLQHPHILPLFDSGTADGLLFYVMPYIEGETLRDKLYRETQFGIDEAVRITREVADALDYAHRQGIVHRDIKPENVLLHDGRPMVADFGIALALSAAAGGRMTETGTSVGTPHYMSPEQATGDKQITGRSDVYSLASVLYEMLAGEPPHTGSSAQAVIMKIIAEPVKPVTALRKSVPPNVAAALTKALEKLPADRFDGAKAFADALADPHFTVKSAAAGAEVPLVRRGVPLWLFAGVTVSLVGLAAAALLHRPERPPGQVARFHENGRGIIRQVDVSPDGSRVVFHAVQIGSLWIRALDADSAEPLAAAPLLPYRISPDNETILGVTDNGDLVTESLDGTARTLAHLGPQATAIWGGHGFVYFEVGGGLARTPSGGGPIDTLIAADSDGGRQTPMDALPDGRTLVLVTATPQDTTAVLFDVDRRRSTPLFSVSGFGTHEIRYSQAGYLVYDELNRLVARPFDPRRGTVGSQTVLLSEGPTARRMGFGVGGNTLAYASLGGGAGVPRIVDRKGDRRALPTLPPGDYNSPVVSPDGRRIALRRYDPGGSRWEVGIYQMPSGPFTPLTRTGDAGARAWSADGQRVAYGYTGRPGVYWRRYDGSGTEERLLDRNTPDGFDLLPDNRRLVFADGNEVHMATIGGPESDSVVLRADEPIAGPRVSHDGRWIAYMMRGQPNQVFVQPFLRPGPRVQVSRRSGLDDRWSKGGHRLYFLDGDSFMEATLDIEGDSIRGTQVTRLFDRTYATFDPLPGDSLFVLVGPEGESGGEGAARAGDVTIIDNVGALLKRLASGGR